MHNGIHSASNEGYRRNGDTNIENKKGVHGEQDKILTNNSNRASRKSTFALAPTKRNNPNQPIEKATCTFSLTIEIRSLLSRASPDSCLAFIRRISHEQCLLDKRQSWCAGDCATMDKCVERVLATVGSHTAGANATEGNIGNGGMHE